MPNRIKIRGTSERVFELGLTNKQIFDASGLTANRTWTLPDSNGSSGYVLSTNGAGVLSWVAQTGGGGTPGGSDTQIQYNSGGSLAASSALTFASNVLQVGAGGVANGTVQLNTVSTSFGPGQIAQNNVALNFTAADAISGNTDGTDIRFFGGDASGSGAAGDIYFEVGNNSTSTAGGKIEFATYGINLQLLNSGAVSVNSSTGTSGQVLTSAGSGAPPTWTTPTGGGGGDSLSPFLLMGA